MRWLQTAHRLLVTTSSLAIKYKSVPYDPASDVAAIPRLAKTPLVLVVNHSLSVRSVSDLIKLAKEKPGQLSYASSGLGSSLLAAELFKSMAGVEIAQVPYNGGPLAMSDVIAACSGTAAQPRTARLRQSGRGAAGDTHRTVDHDASSLVRGREAVDVHHPQMTAEPLLRAGLDGES